MNMRKTGLLLTGGLVLMLVVFIVAYGILLATETMPVHIEIKEPVTSVHTSSQPGNIALPQMVESIAPEYLLTTIYTAESAPLPEFEFFDVVSTVYTVTDSGIASSGTAIIEFTGGAVTVDRNAVSSLTVPATGEVRVLGGTVTILAAKNEGGYVDGGSLSGSDDNTAQIGVDGDITVTNDGWLTFDDGVTSIDGDASRMEVDRRTNDVDIVGGTTIITGLANGGDICRASVIVGRAIVDPNADGQLVWGEFGGRATEARVSGLLRLTVPFPENAAVVASLNIDTGANTNGVIARDNAGNLDTTTDTTADRLATLPLPRTNADPHDGAVLLPLQVGTRVELPAYSVTPAIREIQLVIDLPDLNAIQCAAVTDARWEQPTIGTITTKNTYCGGVPLGGAVGQVLVKSSDDDCGVEWTTMLTVPGTGLDGQLLTWGSSGGEGAYGWAGP